MIRLRLSNERGVADHGWLSSRHTFSFSSYYDPEYMGWGNLRVINEDRIQPGTGFGTHGHRDMEILSYVVSGELAHQDSMGNGSAIPPGDIQRMSAGRGVQHSEYNHSSEEITHFFQIWIEPDEYGIEPGYEQKTIPDAEKSGTLRLVASPDGAEGSVTLHADAKLYVGLIDGDDTVSLPMDPSRKSYVHLVQGKLNVNGATLQTGDGAMLAEETILVLTDGHQAEVLVFDLAS